MSDQQRDNSMTPILVTGGTGVLGRHVVAKLRDAGREVRVLSRTGNGTVKGVEFVPGDLSTGEGVEAAMQGVKIVIHAAGSAKGDEIKAEHVVRAAVPAGVRHLVYISVVGADTVPLAGGIDRTMFGYFGSKYSAEQIVADSGVGWTTLRATQFHELILKTVEGMARMPVVPVPKDFRFQPVAAEEVATRLVELALGEPAGLVPEFGGPRVFDMAELIRGYLRTTGKHRFLLPVGLPGKAARAFREGANIAPDRAVGRRAWEEHLYTEVEDSSSRAQRHPAQA